MSDAVNHLECPHCAASMTMVGPAGVCPRCGRRVTAPSAKPCTSATADAVETVAVGEGGEDAALIADLREALGFGADGPRAAEPAAAGSSAASGPGGGVATLSAGSQLGDFEILGEVGRGGMGVVYRARQRSLDREVALKVLPGYARHGRLAVQRFQAEAQAAARLHHTNIVAVYARGEHDGVYYYAMELVDGVGLDTVIRSRPDLLSTTRARSRGSSAGDWLAQPPDTGRRAAPPPVPAVENEPEPSTSASWTRADYRHLAALVADVADALEYAHNSGIIHRDVKPHNLLLGPDGRLHLTDFGLARLTDEPHLTATGEIMGTPAYLSPEQVSGHFDRIDHRTDIFSLGVTLYELLTRHKPFDGETRQQIITGICSAEPVQPRRIDRHIPIDLETICLRALEKDPGHRHPTAALLAEDLRRFAEGRPILSRRVTRVEKALKWVRRHKALTAALTASVVVLLLAAGLTGSVRASRHRQAQQLLGDAYEQLAYFNYKTPGLEETKVTPAEESGADPRQVHLVRALLDLGATQWDDAIAHARAAAESDPTDIRARYLLSWALHEGGRYAEAATTFEEAEQHGPPATADAWFFRGLAAQRSDPSLAIESYRQANLVQAQQQSFYPQAILHLARARNQQLYATRSLDPFPEAVASLEQLVEHGYYGAYPYYLLSIAHRLAAEIYRGSQGTRTGDALVQEHYAAALRWAREGQQIEPTSDRPVTAEAECLESMGRFDEALEARTRALAITAVSQNRWEACHYRWRLYYWTGQYEAALQDLATCADLAPRYDRFYEHVYPALVCAELGDLPAARDHARALAAHGPDRAQDILWSATCLRLLGRPDEAVALLDDRADVVRFDTDLEPPQTSDWVRALYELCRTGRAPDTLHTLTEAADKPWRLSAEADFHAAVLRLATGDHAGALTLFENAYRSFDSERRYTYHARLILVQLQKNVDWPVWLGVSSGSRTNDPPPGGAVGCAGPHGRPQEGR